MLICSIKDKKGSDMTKKNKVDKQNILIQMKSQFSETKCVLFNECCFPN